MLENNLDAIIFDFDGVIVESADIKTEAFRRIFSDDPAHLDAVVEFHRQNEGLDRLTKFEMIYADILHQPLSEKRKSELAGRFGQAVVDAVIACPMVAGAADSLETLHGTLPMAVASGTPQSELRHIVESRNLSKFFVSVRGSPPDKSQLVAELLEDNNWNPSRVLLIGDAMTDYRAAADHALVFIGRVGQGKSNLFPKDTIVLKDLTELKALMANGLVTPDRIN